MEVGNERNTIPMLRELIAWGRGGGKPGTHTESQGEESGVLMTHSGPKTTECPSTQPPGGRAQRRHESAGTGVEGEWEEAILEEEAEPQTVQEVSCRRLVKQEQTGETVVGQDFRGSRGW